MHRTLAILVLALPLGAQAEGTITATQLMQACTGQGVPADRQCISYIAGAEDQISANPALKGTLCPLPVGTELKDARAALVSYARAHSDKVHGPAIVLLNEALTDRYPCK